MKLTKIGEFLKRSKIPIDIEDEEEYNRVTIRINHNGVSLRDSELGRLIGTKKQFILKSGQFIVSKIDARYGAFGIAPIEVDNAIITGNFWAYDVDTDLINIDWFNQFTNSPVFYEVCERASSGITHRKYLDEKFFLNYQILLPSVEEQLIQIEKINSQKVTFGLFSSELTHQLTLVKKLRQQLLQDAVQGKLVEQDLNDEPAIELLKRIKAEKTKLIAEKKIKKEKELPPIKPEEIPFEIPENWSWCRLGEMSINLDGQRIPVSQSERERKEKIYDYYGASGVIDKIDNYTHDGKFLLIGEDGANLIAKSTPIAFVAEGKFWVNNHAHVLDFFNEVTIYFMAYCLNAVDIKPYITGGFQPKLSQGNLNLILIPLPPLSEQQRILQKLDKLMQSCNELEASIKESQLQNEKLLQQVLREALRKEPVLEND